MRARVIHQYQILRRLGSGAGGVVYYARDTKLLRPVVLKMLKVPKGTGDSAPERVLREARLASAIEHPNVCAIYEVGEVEGQSFIVMQYVPGRTLAQLIARGPLGLPLALSISVQISEGLAEAHCLGIFHRDLKPANIMITDGGLVKILDFGLARRKTAEEITPPRTNGSKRPSYSARGGTLAYMAPEQFVTGQSSEQTDIFSFGVILYEMVTASHPFDAPHLNQPAWQTARAIQYSDPDSPRQKRPQVPPELEQVILKALAKNPAQRYPSVAEMREALRTVMKTLQHDEAMVPVEVPALTNGSEADRKTGIFSMLAERFMGGPAGEVAPNSLAVLPFTSLSTEDDAPFYGVALADTIATRLARLPALVVRPSSTLAASRLPADPLEAGRHLLVSHVLRGSFVRSGEGFTLNWQLLEVEAGAVRTGGTISVPTLDLVAIQNEISDQVFASLRGTGHLESTRAAEMKSPGDGNLSEEYLEARAVLTSFLLRSRHRQDLDEALRRFSAVLERDPEFAAAHSGLGIAHLQYVRHGFGGATHLMAAQKAFERALEFDPSLVEAKLFRVCAFLARGEKESARYGVHHLLETAPNDFDVHMVASTILRLDGLYDSALHESSIALRLNPAAAMLVYNDRARIYGYQGQIELARQEIQKGLTLDPTQRLLRTSLGYLDFRQGDFASAITILESVLREDGSLRLAYPTLALCYLAAGLRKEAAGMITEETLASADADGEMAYRLATYFALDGDATEALHWLRKAIYLGNENYPWFASNPAWTRLQGNEDLAKVMVRLKKTYRQNEQRWKQLIGRGLPGSA
jgi:serine/threonine protein kinase/tetratricopeptide (TPR) repeat protein